MTVARAILIALVALVCAPAYAAPVRIDFAGGHGSGFTIGNRLVLTAAHVVAGRPIDKDEVWPTVSVVSDDGTKATAEVVWANYANDVALLQVTDETYTDPEASALDCSADPVIGTGIEIVGNPFGESFVHTWGRVSSKVGKNIIWPRSYLVDATIAHGESGGPVMTADGKVVGIIVGLEQDNSFGFVVPATTVCKLLAGNKAPP